MNNSLVVSCKAVSTMVRSSNYYAVAIDSRGLTADEVSDTEHMVLHSHQDSTLQLPGLKVNTGAELRKCWGIRKRLQNMHDLNLGSC